MGSPVGLGLGGGNHHWGLFFKGKNGGNEKLQHACLRKSGELPGEERIHVKQEPVLLGKKEEKTRSHRCKPGNKKGEGGH